MYRIALIGIAGLLGTLARYSISGVVARRFGETFPTGTLVVNVVGCFLAGFFFYLVQERFLTNELVRSSVMIGFLGGFTTFSAFGLQTFQLVQNGQIGWATTYVVLSNTIGILTVWLGYSLARVI